MMVVAEGQLFKPMSDTQKNELTDEICIYESLILKTIGFELEIDTPYLYLRDFMKALYPQNEMQFANNIGKLA
jgi:hypothetical protein